MKVRRRRYKSGKIVYQADLGESNGKRVQKSFATRKAAQDHVNKAKSARQKHGERAFALSSVEMADVVLARDKLAKVGATLNEAVDYYLKHAGTVTESITVPELVDRFVRSRENEDCSERYVRQLKVSLLSLARAYPLSAASEITKTEVQKWLRSAGWKPKTRNNYMGDVSAMYGWAKSEGYAAHNPCAGISKVELPDDEIATLKVDDARALLDAARGNAEMMTYIVLAMFCGIRPAEIERLQTAMINVDEKTVIVAGGTAKTGSRRVVDISDNGIAWLKTITLPEPRVCNAKYWAERWRTFRRACGWAVGSDKSKGQSAAFREAAKVPVTRGPWPADVLRHTFASMHYAAFQNESLLKAQMGHWEDTDTLHRHYRALKTKAEAARFWGLWPEDGRSEMEDR